MRPADPTDLVLFGTVASVMLIPLAAGLLLPRRKPRALLILGTVGGLVAGFGLFYAFIGIPPFWVSQLLATAAAGFAAVMAIWAKRLNDAGTKPPLP